MQRASLSLLHYDELASRCKERCQALRLRSCKPIPAWLQKRHDSQSQASGHEGTLDRVIYSNTLTLAMISALLVRRYRGRILLLWSFGLQAVYLPRKRPIYRQECIGLQLWCKQGCHSIFFRRNVDSRSIGCISKGRVFRTTLSKTCHTYQCCLSSSGQAWLVFRVDLWKLMIHELMSIDYMCKESLMTHEARWRKCMQNSPTSCGRAVTGKDANAQLLSEPRDLLLSSKPYLRYLIGLFQDCKISLLPIWRVRLAWRLAHITSWEFSGPWVQRILIRHQANGKES